MTFENKTSADRYWLAFRYVAGEMHAAESDAFLEQLALDQALCEAVAEVVGLCDALLAARQEAAQQEDTVEPLRVAQTPLMPARSFAARWAQPSGWMALGAAACLALVAAWQMISPPDMRPAGQHPSAIDTAATSAPPDLARDPSALAKHWQSLGEGEFALATGESFGERPVDHPLDSLAETDELDTPSWLLAAVSASTEPAPGLGETREN